MSKVLVVSRVIVLRMNWDRNEDIRLFLIAHGKKCANIQGIFSLCQKF